MKIGKWDVTRGPNLQWYFVTVLVFAVGGWKGLFVWAILNVLFVLAVAYFCPPKR